MIRLNVTSTGNVDTDPPAGVPGPIGAMRIKNECWGVSAGRGVSSPSNLAKSGLSLKIMYEHKIHSKRKFQLR